MATIPYTAEGVFRYADAFFDAVDYLRPQFSSKPEQRYAAPADSHMQPTAVLCSLALELYLKCQYMLDHNKPTRGHDCEALFLSLTPQTQLAIKTRYARLMAENPEIVATAHRTEANIQVFENALHACRNVFTE